jgi:hypothetical protein
MGISKRDLEIAGLNWKVRAESAQARVEELEHALNLLVNDAVEWFAHHETKDGAHHDFGIAVAFEVPIKSHITRAVRGADVDYLPLIFWQSSWPDGHKFITVNRPESFRTLKTAAADQIEDPQSGKELVDLIERVSSEWEEAHRCYVAKRESPVVH